MREPSIATGIAEFLTEAWSQAVEVDHLEASPAGARRGNLFFEARTAGSAFRLVATLVPPESLPVLSVTDEAATISLAREKGGVAAPAVRGVCTDRRFAGAPFFVTERLEGETIPHRVLRLAESAPSLGVQLARECGVSLARLHALDAALAPGSRGPDGSGNAIDRALQVLERLMAGLDSPSPSLALGLRWLERHAPSAPSREALLHGDFRVGNLVVDAQGLRGILDWEASHAGDPMEDVAWACVRMWRFGNDAAEFGGLASRMELREGYEQAGGAWAEDRFHWWKVQGTVRWGLLLATQAAAYLRGATPSIVMAASGRRVAELEYDALMLIRPRGRP